MFAVGFLFFTLLLLPAMLLYVLAATLIEPFRPVIQTFLDWINKPEGFYTFCKLMIAANLLVFAALLVMRFRWKRAGKLDRVYIYSVRGWRRLWRRLVGFVLSQGPYWEAVWIIILVLTVVFKIGSPMP